MAHDPVDRTCATLPRGETVLLYRRPGQNWQIDLCQWPPRQFAGDASGLPPTLARPQFVLARQRGWHQLEFPTEYEALAFVATQLATDAPVR